MPRINNLSDKIPWPIDFLRPRTQNFNAFNLSQNVVKFSITFVEEISIR